MWEAYDSVKLLPRKIQVLFCGEAQHLYSVLFSNKLQITLSETSQTRVNGRKIRVVEQRNPPWYSELYHSHPHFRRDRSLKALQRIARRKDQPFNRKSKKYASHRYDLIYRDFIFERLTEGYAIEEGDHRIRYPGRKEARRYFGLEEKVSAY